MGWMAPGRGSAGLVVLLAAWLLGAGRVSAQLGELLWEDDFDTLDQWMTVTGNGSWGWGNGELQFYRGENVQIVEVPGEPGNHALRIRAQAESGPGIVDQWGNPLAYTSGKVTTEALVSVQYGVIEARVRVPDLELGGWPAVWLLGTANYAWPRCGELDLMEMGHRQAFRDLHDTHNGGDGSNTAGVNEAVAANALFYSEQAVTPDNPSGAASLAWDPQDESCRPYYNLQNPLSGRFLIYRLYWDESSLRYTVIDNGVEHDLFESPFLVDEESDELRAPFNLIINLAIGGALTDAYQLGNPGSGLPVSLPLPADLYVDYVRVHRWNGQGEVALGPPAAQGGTFGVYTDTTPVDGRLVPGETAEIYVWENTLSEGGLAPFEGENVLSWTTTGAGWFGAGIMSIQPLNLFGFGGGELSFRIRMPAHVTFKIGVIDAWGNQSYVLFPAQQTRYGLVRNGEWGQARIPVEELRGESIDLRMLSYAFVILEEQGASCTFAVDDIVWTGGETGLADEAPGVRPRGHLRGNHPNPFNPATTIRYELTRTAQVRLDIHSLDGARVATLVEGLEGPGSHAVEWQAGRAASGIYLVRLRVDGVEEVGRCLLIR